MTTTPEDADALFDAPPAPAAAKSVAAPTAPLAPSPAPSRAAPTAIDNPFGGLPVVASADNRREQRVKVSWPGRVQLPNGRVVNLRVRDVSEGGVGLLSEVHIPAYAVLNFAMGVPSLNEGGPVTAVSGTIKTTYLVVQGPDIYCGGTWVQLPSAGRDLVGKWIRRLKR